MAAQLKAIKNAHLTHVSRAINSLQAALDAGEPDSKTVEKYLTMVGEKYDKVVVDSAKLQALQTEEADITKEIDDMDALEDKVIEIRYNAECFLQENTSDSKSKVEGEGSFEGF